MERLFHKGNKAPGWSLSTSPGQSLMDRKWSTDPPTLRGNLGLLAMGSQAEFPLILAHSGKQIKLRGRDIYKSKKEISAHLLASFLVRDSKFSLIVPHPAENGCFGGIENAFKHLKYKALKEAKLLLLYCQRGNAVTEKNEEIPDLS